LTVRTIPVGGVIWEPCDGTRLELVVPYPRILQRFHTHNGHEWWGYLAGEWGGGAWTYKNELLGHENVEYNDYRIIAGVEWRSGAETTAHFEVGYVFNRQLRFVGAMPDFDPKDGFMLRIGLVR